jgi:LPXTG-motif cell wall-anchored protein
MGYLFMRGRVRAFVGLAAMGLGSVVVVGGLSGAAGATGGHEGEPDSHFLDDSHDCTDALGDQREFRVDADTGDQVPDDGSYQDHATGYQFDIDITRHDGNAFLSFDSNAPVDTLYIESDEGCLVYEYPEGVQEDQELPAPDESIQTLGFGCGGHHGHETTTTSEESTTTTEATTTSTTEAPTTSTTEAPTTSTSESTTSTTMAPTTSTTSPGGGLPNTGSNTAPMVAVGAGLLAAGGALVATARIRRNRAG